MRNPMIKKYYFDLSLKMSILSLPPTKFPQALYCFQLPVKVHPPDWITAISTSQHFEELSYPLTAAFESQKKVFTGINTKQIKPQQ